MRWRFHPPTRCRIGFGKNLTGGTAVKTTYQIADKNNTRDLASYFAQNGEMLMPLVELVEGSRVVVDELIDVMGRASIEAVLDLSAQRVAGPRHQGKQGGEIGWHGTQDGVVMLSDRKLRVKKPRLRRRGDGKGAEVPIPAYEALNDVELTGRRVLEILLRGVSTRNYAEVLPQMAESVGMSRSSVSREAKVASEKELKELCERRFDDLELPVIYIDGICFGEHNVIVALGVDSEGSKHLLGLRLGATENATVATELLQDLVARGISTRRRLLFVIDGSKALRAAIRKVFGKGGVVQRCRAHKKRNVLGHLPKELHAQVRSTLNDAWKLEPKKGKARIEQQARWLETEYPDAAASLREGLDEMFTVNRLGLSPALCRSLVTTNIIENPNSSVRMRTRRVTRWRNGEMVKRWAAASFLHAEKNFRKLMGYRDLWMLSAALEAESDVDVTKEVA
jgi:transposase-like protein